ncbi:MAG: HAMP domain-containing histidine kinase [Myxococcales bacterium FL481]|nr:MAG: HAMP domain-containing histidine kinase [Myxococcales bacterium FL481]
MPLSFVLPNEVVDGVFELGVDPALILSSDAQVVLAMNAAARTLLGQHARMAEMMAGPADLSALGFASDRGVSEIALRTRTGTDRFAASYVLLRGEETRFWMVTLRPPGAVAADAEAYAHRLEMIGELAGGLARSFKNVLQAISLTGEPGDARGDADGFPVVSRGVSEALTVGAELLATWNALASADQGASAGRRHKRIDCTDVVKRCESLVRQLTRAIEEVVFEYPVEPVEIDADEGQLIQLILTLCFRARDAVADQLGSSLQVRLTAASEQICLRVVDDGEPLTSDELQVLRGVGEPRGLSVARKRALSTLARLVVAQGGNLAVNSPHADGRGAEFEITFARAQQAHPTDPGRVATTTTTQRRDSIWSHVHERT